MPLASGDLAIAICDRCNRKRPYKILVSDPNYPGLRVCEDGCADEYDPYRLPPPPPDPMQLKYPRPDVSLVPNETFITAEDGSYIHVEGPEGADGDGDLVP